MVESIEQFYYECNIKGRCGKFRTCIACAKLRQARFADTAQSLLGQENALYLTRITPVISSKAEITRVKAAIQHQLGKTKAIWSVEIGTIKHQLHLNLISPLDSIKHIKNTTSHTTEKITNLRQAAAYLLKQEQIPATDSYFGRQHGTWNNPVAAIAQQSSAPVIQALAVQMLMPESLKVNHKSSHHEKAANTVPTSNEIYAARARAWLPYFYANIVSNKGTLKRHDST
jgi:hypothetical protein